MRKVTKKVIQALGMLLVAIAAVVGTSGIILAETLKLTGLGIQALGWGCETLAKKL